MIATATRYESHTGQVSCVGRQLLNRAELSDLLEGPVRSRLFDLEHDIDFEADLKALATTGMATETLKRVLEAAPAKEPWEVGEALAECLLTEEYGAEWPWNVERDKRTPRASLPGADLVGFMTDGDCAHILLGEVKTSSESKYPPQVMYGRSGIVNQIDALAADPKLHRSLIKWLHARCKNTALWSKFQEAIERYLQSGGKAMLLFGILVRDVDPDERDLRNRGRSLGEAVTAPTQVHLHAWYLACSIDELPALTREGTV